MATKDTPAVETTKPAETKPAETKPEKKEKPELTPEELAEKKAAAELQAKRDRDFEAERELREYQKTNTKLFLGNLPRNYRKGEVENLCQRYGKITDIMVNSEKRFALVTFAQRDDAQVCIYDLAEKNVGGLTLHVSWSKPSEQQKKQAAATALAKASANAATDASKPAAGSQQPADKSKATAATPAPPVQEPEKPRFSATQKVAAPKPKAQPAPKQSTPPPQVHHQQPQQTKAAPAQQNSPKQNHPNKNQPQAQKPQPVAAPQPKAAQPKAVPPKFKVTVQNETSGGDPVTVTISFEDWRDYICPLFDKVVVNRQ